MSYGKPLTGICLATAVFVCSAIGAPSLPDSPPPSNAPLSMPSSSGSATLIAGSPVTIHGTGFAPNANISIGVYSSPTYLDAVTADASGGFTDSVTIPASLSGSHTLVAEGNAPDGSPRVLSAGITVRAAPASGSLPFTGLNTTLLALSGFGLIIAGFALVRAASVSRRKRRRRLTAKAAA